MKYDLIYKLNNRARIIWQMYQQLILIVNFHDKKRKNTSCNINRVEINEKTNVVTEYYSTGSFN